MALPNRLASMRSEAVGLPARWMCPMTVSREPKVPSLPLTYSCTSSAVSGYPSATTTMKWDLPCS